MTSPTPPDAVASPCISVCVMLPEAGVCAGCFRTLDEIAGWSTLDVPGRRAVLAALPGRRARWEPLASGVRPPAPGRSR
jgi:predicted Fe-S protein YdhL (DUF1289 family)